MPVPLPPLSREQSRQVDQVAIEQYGMSGLVLMENAGRGAAELINRLIPTGPITILCGQGNNAGDGYVIARHLELLDRDVQVISVVELERLSGDAGANAKLAVRAEIPIQVVTEANRLAEAIEPASTLVDCLLGTGARGDLREPYRTAVEIANRTGAARIAIDLPTGLDCDTGVPGTPTFQAEHTITFVSPKIGFEQPQARDSVGEMHVVAIGAPRKLLDSMRQQFT